MQGSPRSNRKVPSAAWLALLGIASLTMLLAYIAWPPQFVLPNISVQTPGKPEDRGFSNQIWLHRADSIPRARWGESHFHAMETDVTFDSVHGLFDVGHPSTPSIGLDLAQMIAALSNPGSNNYWIDLKNLQPQNAQQAADTLQKVADRFNIRSNMLVESPNPQCLKAFSDRGFYTSYWLPLDPKDYIHHAVLKSQVESIAANLRESHVNAVDMPSRFYAVAAKYFPGYDILLWNLPANKVLFDLRSTYLMRDKRVRVILRDEDSPGYR